MIYTSMLASIQKIIHEEYELSTTIRHRGERGRQREHGLLVFLRENLPMAYGVATGEIIPFKGPVASPQCDIIIYDQLRMPILGRSKAVQQVPLEAVYAVIECKSILDKAALKDAETKFSKIQALSRCPSKTRLKKGMQREPLYILFGYQLKTSVQSCQDFMEEHEETTVVALDSGCGIWFVDSDRPIWIYGTDAERDVYYTLTMFYVSLLEGLRSIDLGEPRFIEMIHGVE
jgi:hypothetical protein